VESSAEGLLIGSVDEKKIHTIKILTSLARIDLNFRRLFQDFKIEILGFIWYILSNAALTSYTLTAI
jgi:hypothetical protein